MIIYIFNISNLCVFSAVEKQLEKIAHVLWQLRRLVPDVVLRRRSCTRTGRGRGSVRQRLLSRVRHPSFGRNSRHYGQMAETRLRS